jgi:hypothetical protein
MNLTNGIVRPQFFIYAGNPQSPSDYGTIPSTSAFLVGTARGFNFNPNNPTRPLLGTTGQVSGVNDLAFLSGRGALILQAAGQNDSGDSAKFNVTPTVYNYSKGGDFIFDTDNMNFGHGKLDASSFARLSSFDVYALENKKKKK